jgi:hypothetical protein
MGVAPWHVLAQFAVEGLAIGNPCSILDFQPD